MMVAVLLTSIMSLAESPQAELQLGMSVFVWTRDPLFHIWTVKMSSGARPLVLTLIKMATRLTRRVASAEGCREGFNKQNKHPSNGKAASSGLEGILQYLWDYSANQIINYQDNFCATKAT